jgi:hypothetical protein
MTLRRATLYVAGGTLLVAWFSSAASMSLGRSPRRAPQVVDDGAPAQSLVLSVQTQARRLKERLATAPLPQEPVRNPFAFRPAPEVRVAPPPRAAVPVATTAPVEIVPDVPLLLVGLAEHRNGDVLVQSAVISSNGEDLIMAEVGTVVVGRYTVTSIGSDAVDLKDAATGRVRRLVLQQNQ